MKRSSMLSRVFFRRPSVRALVPDLKLVLAVMAVSCESHVGVWRPAGLAEDCGLDPAALAGALVDLEKRGHLVADRATGEFFLTDFFRDNTFNSPQRVRQARDDLKQIESVALRQKVLEAVDKNIGAGLKTSDLLQNHDVTSKGERVREGKQQQPPPPRAPTSSASDAPGGGVSPIWQEALALEVELAKRSAKGVTNEPGFRRVLWARYQSSGGPAPDVLNELEKRKVAEAARVAREQHQAGLDRAATTVTHSPPPTSHLSAALERARRASSGVSQKEMPRSG